MESDRLVDTRESGATPRFRVDGAELRPPTPHAFALPASSEIRLLTMWLLREDVTLSEFGERLSKFGGLSRYVCAVANYRGRRHEVMIRNPVHASAYLGIRGLQEILEPLVADNENAIAS